MRRRELAARIARQTGQTAEVVSRVLQALVEAIGEDLGRVGRLELRGLGTFTVRTYPARRLYNPATGKTITLPARKSITYKPSRKVRARLEAARRAPPAKRPMKGGVESGPRVCQRAAKPGEAESATRPTTPVGPRARR